MAKKFKELRSRMSPTFREESAAKAQAILADQGMPIPNENTISFEDPSDAPKLLTAAQLKHFSATVSQDDLDEKD